jgi:hypothetical protein
MKIDSPMFDSSVNRTPPAVDSDVKASSVTSIQGIPVQNTVPIPPSTPGNVPSGGKVPNKLPFD